MSRGRRMGCVSSRPSLNAGQHGIHYATFGRPNHLVCLTSTTYGILNRPTQDEVSDVACSNHDEPIETINAWELMEGLEDQSPVLRMDSSEEKRSPKQKMGPGQENQTPAAKPLKETNPNLQDKENIGRSPAKVKRKVSHGPLTDLRIESSRYFDSANGSRSWSSPLFDPELLASFEASLDTLYFEDGKSALQKRDPLAGFEAKCPPGGQDAVVLYTTSLRGIRKTFEDCNRVRSVVESYGVWFSERDVSMDLGFRKELEDLMGGKGIVPVPKLFIKGKFIGGAHQVLELHEQGKLDELLEGIPRETPGKICDGCGGVRFVPCFQCNGSCKFLTHYNTLVRCPDCNENGLIHCPICC